MRVLIVPDSFKESLSARDAAEAMARGVRRWADESGMKVEIDLCPVADGGEGTVDAVCADARAEQRSARVTGPLGEQVEAAWAVLEGSDGAKTGVIETASCAGMMLVPRGRRDPTRTTTRGLGELLVEAVRADCQSVLVGLGSSSTTDGGIGVATALGWRFLDADGDEIAPTGGGLLHLARVLPPNAPTLGSEVIALCDVDNPLLGEHGSARVFARQKGASDAQIEELERGLAKLVRCLREAGVECDPTAPGAGAAGGLGFGLWTFAGATLAPGARTILDVVGFGERLARADVVITGEGRLDATTLRGKAVFEVARRGREAGVPVIALVGTTEEGPEEVQRIMEEAGAPLVNLERIIDRADDVEDAHARAGELLEECAAEVLRSFVSG
jgi:glycerate 2-kinase